MSSPAAPQVYMFHFDKKTVVFSGKSYENSFETSDPCVALDFFLHATDNGQALPWVTKQPDYLKMLQKDCSSPPPIVTTVVPRTVRPSVEVKRPNADSADSQGAPAHSEPAPTFDIKGAVSNSSIDTRPTGQVPSTWTPPQYEQKIELDLHLSAPRSNLQILGNDPVDLFSGAFYLNDTDLAVPGTLIPLTFERAYRSGAPYLGPFGWGWDHNHNLFLRELANGDVARWNGRLQEQIFKVDGAGFKSPTGAFERLVKIGDGDYRVDARFGTTVRFKRPTGWTNAYKIPVTEIRDRYGNRLVYNYDNQNRIASVTCIPAAAPVGASYHYLAFEYGGCGLLEAVRDSVGRVVYYDHDPDIQHLARVRFPATSDHPEGTSRIYHYEHLQADVALLHNILRVEDDEGRVFVENEYDADPSSWSFGRVITQRYGGYEYANRYTQLREVPEIPELINELCLRVEVFAPDTGLTTYTFNYQGNLLDRRTRLNRDGSWRVVAWGYTYDAEGNLSRIDEPDGSAQIFTYDHEHSDPRMRGNLLQREIDSAALFESRVVWIGTYESTYQLLTSETEAPGDGFTSAELKTTYTYGLLGRLESITYPDATLPDGTTQSAQAALEYNANGQITTRISPEGIRTEFGFDNSGTLAHGRLLTVTHDVGGLGLTTQFEYDTYGYALATIDPSGARTDTVRNALGLVEQSILPVIDGNRSTTTFHYDSDGKVVALDRPRGSYEDISLTGDVIIDHIRRNAVGYPIASEIGSNTGSSRITTLVPDYRGLPEKTVRPDGSVISSLFDERGLLLCEEIVGVGDMKSQSRFVYDLMGRPVEVITGPLEDVRRINHYDGYGRLTRSERVTRQSDGTIVGTGATTVNIWSDRGLLIRRELREYPGTAGTAILGVEEFEYDQRRRLVKSIARPFTATFDETNTPKLITKYFYNRDGQLVKAVSPRGGITTIAYDGAGRVAEEEDSIGNVRAYAYDVPNRKVEITITDLKPGGAAPARIYTNWFDARGRVIKKQDPDGAAITLEYDDRDLVVALIDKANKRHERTYGLLGELTSTTTDVAGLAITNRWDHDLMGRVTRFTDPAGEMTTYSYDRLGRPLIAQYPGGARSIHEYGPDGRLKATRLKSGSRLEYTYDTAGRMATFQAHGVPGVADVPLHTYQYDQLDRLTSAAIGASNVTRSYDSFGRLLSETTHDVALEMAYDDLSGTMTRTWDDGREEELTIDLNGFVTRIERLAAGGLGSGPSLLGEFMPHGRLHLGKAELMNAAVTTTVEYDERKRISQLEHVAGTTSLEKAIYRYDVRDRRMVELLESGTVQRRFHTFDNRRRLTDTDEDFSLTNAISAGYLQSDHDTDISNVSGDAASATIKYDFQLDTSDARTLAAQTGKPNRTYTYNPGHRIATAGGTSFTHYTDGTRETDGANRYEVDALGRVLRVSDPTGAVTCNELAYDPLGRVASITEATGTRRDLSYFGSEIWQETIGGFASRQYSRHGSMPGAIATHVTGASYLTLYDARMNLLSVTDTVGAVLDSCRYEPFGVPVNTLPATGLEPSFGGMRYLADSRLYLAGLRLMDPVEGAWLSHDPAGYVDSPDLYAYAGANPIDFVDPAGAQLGLSGGFQAPPDGSRQNNPYSHSLGLTSKADAKVFDIVHQNDWLFDPLTDAYNSTRSWAPMIYYGGRAAAGGLVGVLELADNPLEHGVIEPAKGAWGLIKATSPVYALIDPKGTLEAQNAIGGGIVNLALNPEEGAFQAGRGAAHNIPLTLATEGVGSWAASGGAARLGLLRGGSLSEELYLFRGTSAGYPGHPSLQRLGLTPTSLDPAVATIFATESSNFGSGVVHIASTRNLGAGLVEGNVLRSLESEVAVNLTPAEFAARADLTISAAESRQILGEMGIKLDSRILKEDLSATLSQTPKLSAEQIQQYLHNAWKLR